MPNDQDNQEVAPAAGEGGAPRVFTGKEPDASDGADGEDRCASAGEGGAPEEAPRVFTGKELDASDGADGADRCASAGEGGVPEGAPRVFTGGQLGGADAAAGDDSCGMDAATAVRGRILRRFEAWLDEVLADEQAPQGLDAEILARLEAGEAGAGAGDSRIAAQQGGDLFSLWSAMVALTQETKLQGRAFKQLREGLSPVEALPGSVQDMLSASREALSVAGEATRQVRDLQAQQVRQAAAEARQEAEGKAVGVLLDIRDRLVRGAQTARGLLGSPEADKVDDMNVMDKAAKPGWLARLFGARPSAGRAEPDRSAAQAARAMLDGYLLSLDRLEESLAAMGISEITCQGQPFDPRRMTAVAVEQTADVPEGTVVEVYRSGYEWNGRVHRPAEVKVARPSKGG